MVSLGGVLVVAVLLVLSITLLVTVMREKRARRKYRRPPGRGAHQITYMPEGYLDAEMATRRLAHRAPNADFIGRAANILARAVQIAWVQPPVPATRLAARAADQAAVLLHGVEFRLPTITEIFHTTRAEAIEERRALAADAGATPAARVGAYFNLAQAHVDDPQTVHDTTANAHLRRVVQRLQEDIRAPLPFEHVAQEVTAARDEPQLAEVLEVIKPGALVMSVGLTDRDALCLVWTRSYDPRNSARADDIRDGVRTALLDCLEDGHVVCATGRAVRILSSLSARDFDERNWDHPTLEAVKNEIFDMSAKRFAAAAEEAAKSADPVRAAVGRSYTATTPEEVEAANAAGASDPVAVDTFLTETKKDIAAAIDAYAAELNARAPGALPPTLLDGIKAEALAAQ